MERPLCRPGRSTRRPDILHCTYQLPLRAKRSCNIYTIHDLVPLRLPFTTLDNKRQTYRLLRKIAAEADHIVTVSENSKRDIVSAARGARGAGDQYL